ncbi:ABC transporter permease subunit [Rossellomorea marisflavi]|uniref:ABC transporter permease subunit n=1 Tax=Rossellomorea marisflavi TaxID=189381 RepID=UPI003457FF29
MTKNLFKNGYFTTGLVYLVGLLGVSVLYFIITGDKVPEVGLIKDQNGDIISPPYSPLDYPPLGTDNFNRSVLLLILVGAKYTIGIGILITLLRVIPAVILGLIVHFNLKGIRKPLNSIVDASNFFPPSLLAFLLMNWVMLEGPLMNPDHFPYQFADKLLLYIIIMVVISLPSLTMLFANEYDKIMSNEFISCSKVLGASNRQYITKHIRPFIVPQIFLIMIREFIIVMLLIAHLGVLSIYIGGSSLQEDTFGNSMFVSLSNEWSGLLGGWWTFLWTTYPWIAFIPVIFISLTILSAKFMLIGASKVVENYYVPDDMEDQDPAPHTSNVEAEIDPFSLAKGK